MQKLKTFALQRPVLFSLLVMVAATLLTEIPIRGLCAPYVGTQAAFYLEVILEQGLAGLLFFALLARFGWLKTAGFTLPSQWRALWLGWPLVIMALINLAEGLVIDTSRPVLIALHLLTALSTGWVEQVIFRGVIVTAFLQKWGRSKRGIYLSVLLPGLLFGIVHFANFLEGRKPLLNNLTQITYAMFFGVIFAACLLRNRSIWPMIVLHAAVDWAGTLREVAVGGGLRTTTPLIAPRDALLSILITFPLLVYGLFVLRKVEPDSLELESSPAATPSLSPVVSSS